ncbi:CPBP family intramembrane metalloprotease, partial [Planktothrix sp. FACHB-1355]
RPSAKIGQAAEAKTATVLIGLWSNPPRILPDAEPTIQKYLDGWFRDRGLSQLYNLQQRSTALVKLQSTEQEIAQQAVVKLAIVAALPTLGFLIGVALLILLVAQRLIRKENSLLAQNENVSWSTPWDAETIWQVFIVGFFGMQLLISAVFIPLAFKLLNLTPAAFDVRSKAIYVLTTYMLVALGGVLVLYFSVKSFLPLPEGWFRFDLFGKWFLWGLGGYFVALPLVIVVSLINQEIWKGEGGSNPLLSLALESKDGVALAIFFFTAAIAAPLFEEFLFRGFLLPSLTRYMPVWGATIASSLLFAVAHLSLSEVLPLTTLGIVLAVVYTRSRNLLAPMLLHSLWNSGTLLSLFILGSGST